MTPGLQKVRIRAKVDIPIGSPSVVGTFVTFDGLRDNIPHFAVAFGTVSSDTVALVRIHSECITGDVFGSRRCDCGQQLQDAIEQISQESGYLIYLRQEGRGIGLNAKMDAYILQDQGLDTYAANRHLQMPEDSREYDEAAFMLGALGITKVRLLTNNLDKVKQLSLAGIEIIERVPTKIHVTAHNRRYLVAKSQSERHAFTLSNTLQSVEVQT